MKNSIISIFSLILFALTVIGCTKDNESINEATDENLIIRIIPIPVPVVDLVISSYTTNIPATTSNCGGVLPNISCIGGTRNFLASVVIVNTGPGNLPPGSLSVDWTAVNPAGSSTQRQTIPHGGIPAGGTFTFTRPYYVGPCGCPPPITYFTHSFSAIVDPGNAIPETNENNNNSTTYNACDGC